MKKIAVLLVISLSLGACSQTETATSFTHSNPSDPQATLVTIAGRVISVDDFQSTMIQRSGGFTDHFNDEKNNPLIFIVNVKKMKNKYQEILIRGTS